MTHTEIKDSCNCMWKHCAHHKTNECANDAVGFDCGSCKEVHWLGDPSLGHGFRLCSHCASAVMQFMGDELLQLMQALSPFVTKPMCCMEAVLKDYYLAYVFGEHGWTSPIRDSRALLEFAGMIINTNKNVPVETLELCCRMAQKHKDLMEAFADADMASIIKEESV